jgi:CRISPR/Cas system-associated exonuclease Cas4 (RecB family)
VHISEFKRPGPATETVDSGARPDAVPRTSPGLDSGASKPAGAAVTIPTQKAAAPAWVLPLEHFSYSSLSMAEICPEQWRQRYILGRKEPPGQVGVLGSLAHRGIEFGLTEKLLTENNPRLEDVISHYHDQVWPDVIDEYGGAGEVIWDDKPEDVRHRGATMVEAYHPTVPRLEPAAVEERFELDLGLPVPIVGFIDLTQKHGRPSIDLKTRDKREYKMQSKWRVQARVYQLAAPLPVEFHIVTRNTSPSVVTGLEYPALVEHYNQKLSGRMRGRLELALSEMNHWYATLGPDETWPTRGLSHSWACGYCGFRKYCPEWEDE